MQQANLPIRGDSGMIEEQHHETVTEALQPEKMRMVDLNVLLMA